MRPESWFGGGGSLIGMALYLQLRGRESMERSDMYGGGLTMIFIGLLFVVLKIWRDK